MRRRTPTVLLIATLLLRVDAGAQTTDTLRAAGLRAPVVIEKDPWGVSHIYAQSQPDLFFAQGWNVARDRLFQLEMWRRQATGTLSEVLGPRFIRQDHGARLLRFRGDMGAEMAHYHPDGEEIIGSFVRGINAYVDHARANPDAMPLELKALGIEPGHWTPEVVVSRHNGLFRNVLDELRMAARVAALGPDAVAALEDFEPETPDLDPPGGLDLSALDDDALALYRAGRGSVRFRSEDLLPGYRAPSDRDDDGAPTSEADLDPRLDPELVRDLGSNNWVVSGERTFTRMPFMANDPHRSQQIPSLRYWVHLVAPGWNVIGGGEPALPGVSIGHNEHGAWGLTIFAIDQEDLYVYDLDPADPDRYRYGGAYGRMRVERERIPVEGQAPMEVALRFTRHGPVVHVDSARGKAYAVRAAWLEPGGAPYLASLRMDQARTWEEFREACGYSHTPSENMVWADTSGAIGWQAVGITPLRDGWDGVLPVPGDGRFEWRGYLPILELPHRSNPPEGYIATANENNLPHGYPHRLGFSWSDPSRSMRVQEVLASGRKLTLMDMMRLQHDELAFPARTLVPLLAPLPALHGPAEEARRRLLDWDFVMDASSPAGSIFEMWRRELGAAVGTLREARLIAGAPGAPALGGEAAARPARAAELVRRHAPEPSLQQVIAALLAPGAMFGDDPVAGRDSVLAAALESAVSSLSAEHGPDMDAWRWGGPSMHHIRMEHPLSELLRPDLAAGLDLGPAPRGGSGYTVNNTGSGMNQTSGASFRIIADLSDWERSVGTNNPGQSGLPGDAHYADLFELWKVGRYFPVPYGREAVRAVAESRTVLVPR